MTDLPRFAYAYRELAIVAEDIRKNRAASDPKLVEAGKLSADDAATRLRVSTAIAVDWQHFARVELPPLDGTTDREKVDSLQSALEGTRHRERAARQAIVNEWGEAFFVRPLAELWALVDANDPATHRVLPFLHWESYAAALEAMLWWQQRPRVHGMRFLTRWNIDLRAMGYVSSEREAA